MEDFFRCFYSPHLICRYDAAAEASKRSMDYSQLPGEPTTRCPEKCRWEHIPWNIWVFALGEKHNSKTLGVWFQVQLHGGRVWSRASGEDSLGCFMINFRVTKTFPWLRGKGGVMIPQNKGPLYNALHKSTNQLLIWKRWRLRLVISWAVLPQAEQESDSDDSAALSGSHDRDGSSLPLMLQVLLDGSL